ncbi:tryptophanase [bacterium]|nr:tryptophanase [bacterium]
MTQFSSQHPEPFKIKMVEPITLVNRTEREKALENAGLNVFNLLAEKVFIDLLTDSGTGAMSEAQWAGLLSGDESYAGSPSFLHLRDTVTEVTGFPFVLPTHQGRAAENVLHSAMIKEGNVIPGNSHFDTTKAHIEFRKARAIDCTIDECFDPTIDHPFKGNVDLEKLENAVNKHGVENIPFVLITVTNNSGGGQPVSLENIRSVAEFCKERKLKLFFDAARFSENAWFISTREPGQIGRPIPEIVHEIFSYGQGMTMSAKKDAIVNIGGFIATNDEEIFEVCKQYNILFEGFITYGGLAGRDMEALAIGLKEGMDHAYLTSRIEQVKRFGDSLHEAGIPTLRPPGGHAIYIDAKRFLPHIDQEQFPAQALVCELYLESGVRAVEIGTVLADRDPDTGKNRPPELELMRLAIPRRVYTDNHLAYVKDALVRLYERREKIRGLKFTHEPKLLRHFSARFEWV